MMLNTRPIGLVFKQHPWDPANVNAWKNMRDPYNIASVLSESKTESKQKSQDKQGTA